MNKRLRSFPWLGLLGVMMWGPELSGYVSSRSVWPDGEVTVRLRLGDAVDPLTDGSASFDAVGEWVINRWSPFLNRTTIRSVVSPVITPIEENGSNDVFFSKTLYGEGFGEALAVTYGFERVGFYRQETDIIVNANLTWDSYRGDLADDSEDLRRVLLHEFGHFIGLDHPDDDFQSVDAIMNSVVSDEDGLLDDDILGVIYLYGLTGHEGGVGSADDHGGLFETATVVALESSTAGALQDWDRDIFKIDVPGPGALDVRTTGEMDTFGYLYIDPGLLFNFNDQAGEGNNMRMVTPFFTGLSVYVVVEAYWGGADGSYTLETTFIPDVLNGDTVAQTLAEATVIPANGSVKEAINFNADMDLYRIDLEEAGILTATSFGTTDVLVALYDAEDELISFDDDSGPGSNFELRTGMLTAGTYYLEVSSLYGASLGSYELVTTFESVIEDPSQRARLSNMSVRTGASGEFGPLIMGFVTAGSSKTLLIRAVGAGLEAFGVPDFLPDPQMSLIGAEGEEIAANDDWIFSDEVFQIALLGQDLGAFDLESELDSAMIARPASGAYTVVVEDYDNEPGQVLIEAYDADGLTSQGRLTNLSTRAEVGLNGTFLTAGFVISGEGDARLLIRGVGPELGNYGVIDVLADPILQVFNQEGEVIASNDNWGTDADQITETSGQVGAFGLTAGSGDAALVIDLPAGVYTVQLKGVTDESGQGLIEIYEVP